MSVKNVGFDCFEWMIFLPYYKYGRKIIISWNSLFQNNLSIQFSPASELRVALCRLLPGQNIAFCSFQIIIIFKIFKENTLCFDRFSRMLFSELDPNSIIQKVSFSKVLIRQICELLLLRCSSLTKDLFFD